MDKKERDIVFIQIKSEDKDTSHEDRRTGSLTHRQDQQRAPRFCGARC